MPRRKGQGISPAKKTVHNKDEAQSKKKAADNNEDPGGGRLQTDDSYLSTTSSPCDLNNSKYLHKKFKKMATAISQEFTSEDSKDALVNGVVGSCATVLDPSARGANNRALKAEGVRSKEKGSSPSLVPASSSSSTSSSSSSSSSSSVPQQGRYVCPYCKLPCAKPSVLQKHIRAHTNERPYPCKACGFAFKTRSNLYKHCRSRAHAIKMEEEGLQAGTKSNVPSTESSDVEDDEDENLMNSSTPPPSCSQVSSLMTATVTVTSSATSTAVSETNNNDKPRQIYKPKFHRVALYKEEEEEHGTAEPPKVKISSPVESPPVYHKTPPPGQYTPLSTINLNIKNSSSPSPEFLQQHISKLINDNKVIVETVDPQWPKKFLQRQSSRELVREGSPASPLSPMSSPGIDATSQWPKRHMHRTLSLNEPAAPGNPDAKSSAQSRLALALLRPSRHETSSLSPKPSESPLSVASTTPEPAGNYQQPLNLTTAHHANSRLNPEDLSSVFHRKRCYSEGFVGRNSPATFKNVLAATTNDAINYHIGQSNSKLARMDGNTNVMTFAETQNFVLKNSVNEKLLYHPQNPEGSIIKDLLLKARGDPAGIPTTSIYAAEIIENSRLLEPVEEENALYVCPLCDIHFRNAQNLEIHQRYYCKGESAKVLNISSPQHSPNPSLKYSDYHPHIVGNVDDNINAMASSSKSSHLRGLQPLNVVKGSSKIGKQDLKTSPSRESGKTTLVVPPFPSPGPLLGTTPLVESYHQSAVPQQKKRDEAENEEMDDRHRRGPIPKKRRLDSELSRDTSSTTSSPDIRPLSTTPLSGIISPSTTTLRSLEELSRCPMRPNSLQMFGGEVQILDGAGETKTMRIEPSSRGGKSPGATSSSSDLMLSLPGHLQHGGVCSSAGISEEETEAVAGSVSPQIVTIARCGFNSGGTIVQVPQKTSGLEKSGLVKAPRTSSGSVNPMSSPSPKSIPSPLPKQKGISGGMLLHSSPSTSPYCTAALLTPNTNTITNTFPDTTKLLVPIVPNIATPNLAVPGIPAPNLSHHMPFIPFAPLLPDGTLFNPLTSITAFNPLTLPPHQSPHILQTLSLPPSQTKERKSPAVVSSSPISKDLGCVPPPYTIGVGTILHGGKAIPYVPGMPGPDTLLVTGPPGVGVRKELSPKPLDLASPSREAFQSFKAIDSNKRSEQTFPKHAKCNITASNVSTSSVGPFPSSHYHKEEITKTVSSKATTNTLLKVPKTPTLIPSIKVDAAGPPADSSAESESSKPHVPSSVTLPPRKNCKAPRPDILPIKETHAEKEDKLSKEADEGRAKKTENSEESKTKGNSNGNKPKFLRPSTLPLKPGTFIPKKHLGTGLTPTGPVLSLISPETPRPRKSYGQLYLNGHAYTYLGLKCSTRAYYCTLNRPQPMYVLQSPEHPKLSMYSNWKVCNEVDPNPFGLDPRGAMALYDSRHRPATFTVARPSESKPMVLTHSSYWLDKNLEKLKKGDSGKESGTMAEGTETSSAGDPPPRRVKIFDGGFESNEDYIYVRGRGRGRYVCEECGIRCKKPSMLKKHIRTHTDVRPFTCKHCNFSFKTKGNLTKHMKSKAHYKKCMELGIDPVPTIVDDSYIDEECLARQQALRIGEGDSDSEDNDEEDDDEDDDEEEDDEEQNQLDAEDVNVNKGKLEREAACSLLSLSESTCGASSSSHYVSAGLVPLTSNCGRPTTYPYFLTLPIPGPHGLGSSFNAPQTPTLTSVSAQTEHEKVSRNTGLALELKIGGDNKLKEEEGRTIQRRGNAPTLVLIPPQAGDANRYYFPSCRTPTIATSVPVSTLSKTPAVDVDSDSDCERAAYTDDEDSERSNLSSRSRVQSDKNKNDIEVVESNASAGLQPMDLSNKSTCPKKTSAAMIPFLTSNNARTPTTPISEILTPVSEPATLLASLCSSVERFPGSTTNVPDPAETTMLQAYLQERALQDVRIKQHQFHHNHQGYTTTTAASGPVTTTHETIATRTLSFQKSLYDKEVKEVSPRVTLKILQPPVDAPSTSGQVFESETEKSSVQDSAETPVSDVDSERTVNVTCKMSLSNNIVRNVVVCGIGFTSHQPASPPTSSSSAAVNKNISPVKPKAEFLPPSSGPSPSYVSMTEDGRSICVICNKVFSKPSQLRLHVNIHYFERPFRCESCAVSFRTKGHLQKHERSVSHQNKVSMNSTFGTPTTTNPRPFKCDDCKIAFRIHGHLAKHLRSKMHIMKLECVGKLPFGTYAEMEREGISLNEIDTTDCDNSLESLQVLAQKLYEKDPSKLGQWDGERGEMLPSHPLPQMSGGETSSDEGEPLIGCQSPPLGDIPDTASGRDDPDKREGSGSYSVEGREGVENRQYNNRKPQHRNKSGAGLQSEEVEYDERDSDGGPSCLVCHKTYPNLAALQVHSFLEHHSHKVPNASILVATEDGAPNYLSQLRKRPPMTEVQSEAPFPKRPVPNSADEAGDLDVNKLEIAPNNGTKQKEVECSASVQHSAKSDVCEVEQQRNGLQNKLNCDLCGSAQSSPESLQKHLLSHAQSRFI